MFNHLELIATTIRFSISVSFSPQPSSASNPSHKVRSSDSQRESEQHHFRLAPHGSSKVGWQFLAGSERSGALRLLSPQRQRFLRPGEVQVHQQHQHSPQRSAFGVNPGLFIPPLHLFNLLHFSSLLQFHQHQLLPHARSGPAFVQRLVQKVVRSTSTNSSWQGLFEVLG